ncbi:DEKNAAC105352 [Brettanomyces naardenensis]|uniref:DEKNAAC105352 n=1 Tax=Brettanomyces naardenensis TaxID=13370 RepID=A0A448YTJ8_BRENA|nr:DEKNAAC105352 [Brettanomyces naardenensis]
MTTSGTFYQYSPNHNLFAFEFGTLHSKKVLIFVGGLGDGFLTVPYLSLLAQRLAQIGWSLIQIQTTSSYIGWGTGSLWRDSSEIAELATYLKSKDTDGGAREVVGIMGHSTGCQNTIHYFTRQSRDSDYCELDFGIIQAPVSDRYAAKIFIPEYLREESIELAKKLIDEGNELQLMPYKYTQHFFGAPINAYRWYSLMSIRGDDDFFSPDLTADDLATTFGKFDKPLLVLYSGDDEFVPEDVDKEEVMRRFSAAAKNSWSEYSKIVKGGSHNLKDEEPAADAVDVVVKFLGQIAKGA